MRRQRCGHPPVPAKTCDARLPKAVCFGSIPVTRSKIPSSPKRTVDLWEFEQIEMSGLSLRV
jgi:hypothetical protein